MADYYETFHDGYHAGKGPPVPSAAELAAQVRAGITIHPDEPTDVHVFLEIQARDALDALLTRCETAERETARLRGALREIADHTSKPEHGDTSCAMEMMLIARAAVAGEDTT